MKKTFLLIICLLTCSGPCLSVDAEAYSDLIQDRQMYNADHPKLQKSSSDVEGSDDFYNELINEDYGCNMSPAFMNRGDMNPNESDYGYGGNDAR